MLKKRVKGVTDGAVPPEGELLQSEDAADSTSVPQSPSKDQGVEAEVTEGKHTFLYLLNIFIYIFSFIIWFGVKTT